MSNLPIRIILVDDHQVARESWTTLLGYDERFLVISTCDNGQDAIELASELKPDIMIVDVNMNPVNGFEVTQKVLEENPSIRIIGISINNHPSYATRMLEKGARGFITKGTSFDEITRAIVDVHRGEQYLCMEIR
ncbi:MAG TPA: response regulator transcription factor [Chitinophagaceae bacterium]